MDILINSLKGRLPLVAALTGRGKRGGRMWQMVYQIACMRGRTFSDKWGSFNMRENEKIPVESLTKVVECQLIVGLIVAVSLAFHG